MRSHKLIWGKIIPVHPENHGKISLMKPIALDSLRPRLQTAFDFAQSQVQRLVAAAIPGELKVKGGVRVEAADGAAARSGIREGDVILSLDNAEVSGAKQFEALAAKLDRSKPATVLVRRGEAVNFVVIRPGR